MVVDFRIVLRTSLVAQWLRICLAMEGTWFRFLVGELRSHKPWGNSAHASLLLSSPDALEPVLQNKRSHCSEKLSHSKEA